MEGNGEKRVMERILTHKIGHLGVAQKCTVQHRHLYLLRKSFFWHSKIPEKLRYQIPNLVYKLMGSLFGDWPSYDPHNFTQLRPSDPSNPSRLTPATYHPTHDRTLPPPDQVISTESKNILIRHFYKHAEDKLRPKRAASEHLAPENGAKHMRASTSAMPL